MFTTFAWLSFIYSFTHSLNHSLTHSLTHLFIYLFLLVYWFGFRVTQVGYAINADVKDEPELSTEINIIIFLFKTFSLS